MRNLPFAENLRLARTARRMSRSTLANDSGVSRRALVANELHGAVPGIDRVSWLAQVLGVDPGELAFMDTVTFRARLVERGTAEDDLALVPRRR